MDNLYRIKNSKNWYYSFSHNGKHYQGSTKTPNRKIAEQVIISIKNDVIKEVFNLPIHNKNKSEIFSNVWNQYIENQSCMPGTIEKKKWHSKHFIPIFGNRDLKTISTLDIEKYQIQRKNEYLLKHKNIKENNISFSFINSEIMTLSHFFNYCIKNGYIDKNPCAGIKKLNELSRLKTLSDDDIEKLIVGTTNKLTRDIITFLIYTGCRKGEALNLKWDDVDLKNDVIAIKGTKTKYDRYIPISKPLKDLLSGIDKIQDCLYVFNKNGAKINDFKRSFHTACKNAGLKDLRIHDLRHVFASKMVMNGTSLYITGELLGHRTTQMTKRYSHLAPDTLRKAVDEVWGKNT